MPNPQAQQFPMKRDICGYAKKGTRLTGVGMMGMRERIKSLRGRFNIRSSRRWHETSGITHRLANS